MAIPTSLSLQQSLKKALIDSLHLSARKKKTGLLSDSIILAHQIRTISKNRLKDLIGGIDDLAVQEKINEALRIHLNL